MTKKRGREQFNKYKWAITFIVSYYRLFSLRRRKKIFATTTIINKSIQESIPVKLIQKRGCQ